MILRLSTTLSQRLKTQPTVLHPLHATAFADWSVHYIRPNREAYFVVMNTRSLYTVIVPAAGIVSPLTLEARVLAHLKSYLIADGFEFFYRRFVGDVEEEALFSKPLDAESSAIMLDLGEVAMFYLGEDGLDEDQTARKMNDTPLSALDGNTPQRAFRTMGF